MTLHSYHTLNRFHSCTKSPQNRDLDDIRSVQRDLLQKTRAQFKNIKMYRNRPTLAEFLHCPDLDQDDSDEFQENLETRLQLEYQSDDYPSSQTTYETPSPDCDKTLKYEAQSQLTDWSSPAPDNFWSTGNATSSWSTPSCSASSSPLHLPQFDDQDIPSFLLDTPSTTPIPTGSGNSSPYQRRFSKHTTSVKSIKKSPSLRKMPSCDPTIIQNNLRQFYDTLGSSNSDKNTISAAICYHWQTLLLSFQSSNTSQTEESVATLIDLSSEGLILPQAIVHMLQHGLIFSIKDLIYRLNGGYMKVCRLLVKLMQSCPSAIPYLIEIMSRSSQLDELNDAIFMGSNDDAKYVIEFYSEMSKLLMKLMANNQDVNQFEPMIPEILVATGVDNTTLQSYSLDSTMRKLIKPRLIHNTIGKCLERSQYRDEHLVNQSLLLLSDCLKMCYYSHSTHTGWVLDTLAAFRDSRLDDQLNSLIKGLNRLIKTSESSEHSSQGHMVEVVANRILEQLKQFSIFYHNCYGQMSAFYVRELNEKPVDPRASRSSTSVLDFEVCD